MEPGRDILRRGEGSSGEVVDLGRLAVRRLVLGAWMALGVAVVALLVSFLRQPNLGIRAGTDRPVWLWGVGVVLSVGLLFVARAERLAPARRVDAGLAFVVVVCFLSSIFRHWLPYAASDVVRGVPPGAIVVLFFAVLVPAAPARVAIMATACALADALGLALTVALGNPSPPWNLWLWLLLPNAVVVGLAFFTARFVHQLGESVRRAREMGAYHLVERLGAGGMGEVWRADHRTLARPAAIKLVRPDLLGDPTAAERVLTRFEREARATAALTSPHTIHVYDFGRSEDGGFYYVMELLEGMDLQTLVSDHGPLPEARVVHLLLQACHSLGEAHGRGVVHRDVKPANLYVCRVGDEHDFVKVLDFGLVKLGSDAPTDEGPLTDAGAIVGTPGYMAPEAAMGEEATPRSDLYALGCVAYFALTRRQVFEGRPPLGQLFAHTQLDPDPPSAHVPVDPALEAVVMRCLAKDPAARPASASALAAELRATGLASDWTPDEAAAWWARRAAPVSDDDLAHASTVFDARSTDPR